MTRISRFLTTVSALALLGGGAIAQAQSYTFFPNNATINYAVNTNYSVVGYASGTYGSFLTPSSPTVNVVSGGTVGNNLYAYNTSTVNLSGGSVGSF